MMNYHLKACVWLNNLYYQWFRFIKVDHWLTKDKEGSAEDSQERQHRLEAAMGENRILKSDLTDTKTSIALLKAELNQMRSQYDSKCSELSM